MNLAFRFGATVLALITIAGIVHDTQSVFCAKIKIGVQLFWDNWERWLGKVRELYLEGYSGIKE